MFLSRLIYFLISVSILFTINAYSQNNIPITGTSSIPNMQAFDKNFVSLMKRWRIPGASLVVIQNGKITAERGYGWADVENQQTINPNSRFRIASASKTFTAVSILKLAEEHKLNLNDKVFYILNDLPPLNNRKINPQIYQITVLDLLQMSSGWFNSGAGHFDPLFGPWPKIISSILSPELPASCQTTTRFMMSMPLKYKPGSHFAYSNLDYCILGLIINKVTATPYGYSGYENYVKSNILAPIGIQDMSIGSTQLKYRLPNEVHYYQDNRSSPAELADSFYLPYNNMEILKKNFSNGGWVASAKDLAIFIYALSHNQILNQESFQLMQTKPHYLPKKISSFYTMGGRVFDNKGQITWVQTGSFTGTNAYIVTKPNKTILAVIFNARPNIYSFLTKFRPELRRLLVNNNF